MMIFSKACNPSVTQFAMHNSLYITENPLQGMNPYCELKFFFFNGKRTWIRNKSLRLLTLFMPGWKNSILSSRCIYLTLLQGLHACSHFRIKQTLFGIGFANPWGLDKHQVFKSLTFLFSTVIIYIYIDKRIVNLIKTYEASKGAWSLNNVSRPLHFPLRGNKVCKRFSFQVMMMHVVFS